MTTKKIDSCPRLLQFGILLIAEIKISESISHCNKTASPSKFTTNDNDNFNINNNNNGNIKISCI